MSNAFLRSGCEAFSPAAFTCPVPFSVPLVCHIALPPCVGRLFRWPCYSTLRNTRARWFSFEFTSIHGTTGGRLPHIVYRLSHTECPCAVGFRYTAPGNNGPDRRHLH